MQTDHSGETMGRILRKGCSRGRGATLFDTLMQWFATFTLCGVLPASGGNAMLPAVTNVQAELHAHDLGYAYETARGLAICVRTDKGWILWRAGSPHERTAPASACRAPNGASIITPDVIMAGQHGWAMPTFGGAMSIRAKYDAWSGEEVRTCQRAFSPYYVVTYPNGKKQAFYVIARLAEPEKLNFSLCSWNSGRPPMVTFRYGTINVLQSVDIGGGATILWADGGGYHPTPVLLRVRRLPSTPWTSNGQIYIIPRRFLEAKFIAAGDDQRARYEAVVSVIRSLAVRSSD